ncbi:2233_t:CDS:1 [Gigaspora margarita]|uniref:2233_t:CDS:1 n=1 Tax=Gigaspora margarita TaxID=4874 RepID=A0ABN7W4V9_GIGMA|nr:2233_t:CDS:1 [Gigaspora margarita]
MCTNTTNKLIVNQQLILDQPETFIEKYTKKNDYEIYINESEIICVIKTNNNIPIAIFLKCVLKRYLKKENQQAQFNTCMTYRKFTYTPVLERFEFSKLQSLNSIKHTSSNRLITENINCCNEPNILFTNCIQKDMKIDLHFPDHIRIKLFFKTFIDWCRYKLYECKHENITVYNNKFKKIDQFVKKDLFYY